MNELDCQKAIDDLNWRMRDIEEAILWVRLAPGPSRLRGIAGVALNRELGQAQDELYRYKLQLRGLENESLGKTAG